jgi:hypothetical protein
VNFKGGGNPSRQAYLRSERENFIMRTVIIAVSAALFSLPAFGQQPGQAPTSIPDFSGIWAHLTFPDVEPPLSGPGPVRNLSRVTIEVARTLAPYNESTSAGASPNGVSNLAELVGDFANPILKPQAAEVVKRHGEFSKKKLPYPTPSNQCWPGGVPFVFWNIGMQMLQQKDKVTILYANDYDVRHVYLNGKHPAHVTPSWYGDSVGHYEGDTLVIDTVGIKVGPFAMLDMYGTPHTEALHVVERYRLLDYQSANESEDRGENENFRFQVSDTGLARNPNYKGPGLLLEFTVEDPGVFTTPWSARITYRRPLGSWPEAVCAESTRDYVGRTIDLPHADKPDF